MKQNNVFFQTEVKEKILFLHLLLFLPFRTRSLSSSVLCGSRLLLLLLLLLEAVESLLSAL